MKKLKLLSIFMLVGLLSISNYAFAESIEVWQIHSPIKEIMDSFDWSATQFESETGIKVNLVRIPTDNFHSKLVTSISAHQYPDMVIWNIKPGIEFSELNIIAEVSDLLDGYRKEFDPGILKMFQLPLGKQWEIPLFSRPGGYHFRKDWLKEVGLNPEPMKNENGNLVVKAYDTWEDFYETGKKLTRDTDGDGVIDRWGAGFAYNRKAFGDSASFAFSVMSSFGGKFLDPETGDIAINSPETIAAFSYLKKLYKEGIVPPDVTAWDGYGNNLNFMNGKVGIVMNSNSIISALKEDNPKLVDNVGITIPPRNSKTGIRSFFGNPETITIFKTKNLKNTKQYAKFLLKEKNQIEMFKIMGVGYYSPVRDDVLSNSFFDSISEQQRMFMEVGKFIKGIAYPGAPNAKLNVAFNSYILDDALARISVDDWTPERAVKEMETRLEEILEE